MGTNFNHDVTIEELDKEAKETFIRGNEFDYGFLENRAKYPDGYLKAVYLALYETKPKIVSVDDELDELILEFHPDLSKEERDKLKKESLAEVEAQGQTNQDTYVDEEFVPREKLLVTFDFLDDLTSRAAKLITVDRKYDRYLFSAVVAREPFNSNEEKSLPSIGKRVMRSFFTKQETIDKENIPKMKDFLLAAADADYRDPEINMEIEGKLGRPLRVTYTARDLFNKVYEKLSNGEFELDPKEFSDGKFSSDNIRKWQKKILNYEKIPDDEFDYANNVLETFIDITYQYEIGKLCNTNIELYYNNNKLHSITNVNVERGDYQDGYKFKNFKYNKPGKALTQIRKVIESYR